MGASQSCCEAKSDTATEVRDDKRNDIDLTGVGSKAEVNLVPGPSLETPMAAVESQEEILDFPGERKQSFDDPKAVLVSLTIDGLDYDELARDDLLLNSFGKKVKDTIAAEGGNGLKLEHIAIELTRGSVKVDAKVLHPTADMSRVQSSLTGSTQFSSNVVEAVKRIPGIEKVSTGAISIKSLYVRSQEDDGKPMDNLVEDNKAPETIFEETTPEVPIILEEKEEMPPLLEPDPPAPVIPDKPPKKKAPFAGESKMEELQINGLAGVMDDDWCADAQRRVILGADGLWCRFGATPGPSFVSQAFAFQFNPCVSFFAVALLFGLVGFCCVPPGTYCSRAVDVYEFTDAGTTRRAKKANPQPGTNDFPAGTNTKFNLINGQQSDGSTSFYANLNGFVMTYQPPATSSGASAAISYPITIKQQFEDYDCFMPKKEFDDWMAWVTECFTWLYIITQNVWIVFAIWLYFSRFGNIKLGRDEDEPEFSYFAWFSMLFTCGVATGLFFFAVSEPQWYYLTASQNAGTYERDRWTYAGVYVDQDGKSNGIWSTPNYRAQNAMTTTWYHWGLHGWVCYCLLGTLLALLHFRKGLPMTIKSCFYPLMGTSIYGFLGDTLDTISVVATTMGVCTSLGLGVMQINTGLEIMNGDQHWMGEGYYNSYNWNDWKDRESDLKKYWDSWSMDKKEASPWYDAATGAVMVSTAGAVAKVEAQSNQQMLLIWIITAGATCSVMLGLKHGIKQLALLCLALGQFVIFYVWMMDDTWFLSNLIIQTFGHYIGELPVLGFYSSAIEQSEIQNPFGEYAPWMNGWTIFYWGWWIAWAPFVGVFLARIGKARTVKEFVFCTLFSACIYNFIFMGILGGAGLKMQMLAELNGVGMPDTGGCGSTLVSPPGEDPYLTLAYKQNVCRQTSTRKYSGEKEYFCSTVTNLACTLQMDSTRPLFDVMSQYADIAKGMTVIVLITITLYFVASSDSGSMVDDMMTANGLPEPCLAQRLFWALTEGAAAAALLSIGKYVGTSDGGLKALRSASICVGLPYTFLICFMCVALYRALQYEADERQWKDGFRSSIIDVGITFYSCGESLENNQRTKCFNGEKGSFNGRKILELARNFVCPTLPLWSITSKLSEKKNVQHSIGTKILVVSTSVLFLTWFVLMFVDYAPLSENYQEWGSIMGNSSTLDGNSRYYLSNRWGYYHEYANHDDQRDPGQFVRYSEWTQDVNGKGHERAIVVADDGTGAKNVGVGERMAHNLRIATFGWFFLFMFLTYLTSLRSDIRDLMKIQGTLVEDFLVCCLWPFALWQMDDQLNVEMEPAGKVNPKDTI